MSYELRKYLKFKQGVVTYGLWARWQRVSVWYTRQWAQYVDRRRSQSRSSSRGVGWCGRPRERWSNPFIILVTLKRLFGHFSDKHRTFMLRWRSTLWLTGTKSPHDEKSQRSTPNEEQPIYFVGLDMPPSSERRLVRYFNLFLSTEIILLVKFISDTLVIFAAFQNLLETAKQHDPDWYTNWNQSPPSRLLNPDI